MTIKDARKLFLRDYRKFKAYATKESITSTEAETVQLFAIYRKDLKTEELMQRSGARTFARGRSPAATNRQLAYLANLLEERGKKYKTKDLYAMTMQEASRQIDELRNNGTVKVSEDD